ncbi:acetylcholinesterase [Patella vulgata]|uniref:acetylcholinesterase n=1 Tax=Patella vulgata TaxID=6465 RepID=UPI00217F4E3C|nr:acetylcholinesterase [Patella vulgata]
MDVLKFCWFLILFLEPVYYTEAVERTVTTKVGSIKGKIVTVQLPDGTSKEIAEFLGIPYGAPPVGDLRFEKSVPAAKFNQPYDALNYGLPCPQHYKIDNIFTIAPPPLTSEDCLKLDIYSPQTSGSNIYPVMLFFYGGSFTQGQSSMYNGQNLAAYGEVVMVTINYRVGPFGFLSTGDDEAPGNYGLWDQHLAIKWVKNNIHSFGGDDSRITIFGQSAGGVSVAFQTLYSGNKGMFQRAITESGPANAKWATKDEATAFFDAKKLALKFNCTLPQKQASSEIVRCLKSVKNFSLLAMYASDDNGFSWGPMIENDFIKNQEIITVGQKPPSSKAFFQNFDMIIGTNGYEGHFVMSVMYQSVLAHLKTVPIGMLRTAMRGILETSIKSQSPNTKSLQAMVDAAMFVYSNAENPNDINFNLKQINDFVTDNVFFMAAVQDVVSHAYMNNRTKTYQYEFNHAYPALPPGNEWLKGATHGGELPFVFGFPSTLPGYEPQIAKMAWPFSKIVMDYWTNFAKTGNPNKPRDVATEWKAYNSKDEDYLYFPMTGTTEAGRYLHARRKNFWLNYLPQIVSRGIESGTKHVTCEPTSSSNMIMFSSLLYSVLAILSLLIW